MSRLLYLLALVSCSGCAASHRLLDRTTARLTPAPTAVLAEPVSSTALTTGMTGSGNLAAESSGFAPIDATPIDECGALVSKTARPEFLAVSHQLPVAAPVDPEEPEDDSRSLVALLQDESLNQDELMPPADTPAPASGPVPVAPDAAPVELNLPTALAMVGGQHPAVGFAQWRVQEAYAQLDRAQVLWLPSIQAGFSFHRHDGNLQDVGGRILDVNRNSFQYGLGVGAVGAGTTPRPGLVAQFHAADAIFQPSIARKTAWARGHAANAVVNQQLLTAATAYLDLLAAHQDAQILHASRDRFADLVKLTGDFAAAGQGLQADADRMQTELALLDHRLSVSRERIDLASARLAQALSVDGASVLVPLDPTVVPIELLAPVTDKPSLIETGLVNRPELKESQALVAAACDQYRRQKYAPFVPSVLLGFSTGGFGGGLGNELDNVDGRYDFDALMSWEIRNLGLGERAARREASARVQQARYEKLRVMDQVARDVAEAASQVQHRSQQILIAQRAVQSAEASYERNVSRIRDAQGLPLEVLQSVRALEEARQAYLRAVIDHNQAQFRLQWALGWPVTAAPPMPAATPEPLEPAPNANAAATR